MTIHTQLTTVRRPLVLALAAVLNLGLVAAVQAKTGPSIQLFPSSVVENLRSSSEAARSMEDGLHPVVQQMEQQLRLYEDAQCAGESADPGCTAIKQNLSETYSRMLGQFEAQLPAMRSAMVSTRKTLGGRIRGELGRKMTPRDLQRLIEGKHNKASKIRQVSSKRKGRISQTLAKYHKMISLQANQGDPLAVLAADIYLDASETLEYIDSIEMEIARSRAVMVPGTLWYGEPSEAMVATVSGVKGLLFGEVEDAGIPDDRIGGREPGGFDDSDLIID